MRRPALRIGEGAAQVGGAQVVGIARPVERLAQPHAAVGQRIGGVDRDGHLLERHRATAGHGQHQVGGLLGRVVEIGGPVGGDGRRRGKERGEDQAPHQPPSLKIDAGSSRSADQAAAPAAQRTSAMTATDTSSTCAGDRMASAAPPGKPPPKS